jgi:hypothetical protein
MRQNWRLFWNNTWKKSPSQPHFEAIFSNIWHKSCLVDYLENNNEQRKSQNSPSSRPYHIRADAEQP